jgi:hypothetical protein
VFGAEAEFTRMKQNSCFSEFLSKIGEYECILVLVWKPKQTGSRGKPRFDHIMFVILKWILKGYNKTLKNKSGKGSVVNCRGKYGFLKIRSSRSVA